MGIKLFSSCKNDTPVSNPKTGTPNKFRWKILREYIDDYDKWVVALIQYEDYYNYQGKKILVYDNIELYNFNKNLNRLDPQFIEYEFSPVARFEPSERGWDLAIRFCERILRS